MRHSNLIGIDISDTSIKVLCLSPLFEIIAYGGSELPAGIVVDGKIVDVTLFTAKLNEILNSTKPNVLRSGDTILRAILTLSESKLFRHYVAIPNTVQRSDFSDYIKNESAKVIPFNLDDLYWDFRLIKKGNAQGAVFVGAEKENIDNYVRAFSQADIKPARIGSELFALGTALLSAEEREADVMLVDLGSVSTKIGIFRGNGNAYHSVNVEIGGTHITQKIAESLVIETKVASDLKKKFGLTAHPDNRTVDVSIKEALQPVIKEVVLAKEYFLTTHKGTISSVVLSGGTALLPGLAAYIQEQIGVATRVGNPLTKIKGITVFDNDAPALFFSNVIGVALAGTGAVNPGVDLLTQYRYASGDTEKEKIALTEVRSLSDFKYVSYAFYQDIVRAFKKVFSATPHLPRVHFLQILVVAILTCALGFLAWVIVTYI